MFVDILQRYQRMDYEPALESRAAADRWLKGKNFSASLFIDGQWREAADGATFNVRDPANGTLLANVSQAGEGDVDAAVRAACKALPKWQAFSAYQRARLLYAIGRMMQRHARLFAVLESLDNGKPIRESRDIDIPLVIRHFLHHAGWAQVLEQEFHGYTGVGVAAQIIPWNFPLLMLAWKIAPALAAGCTVVLKPAELTPLSAILFAEICVAAGVPKGVVNIIHGGGNVGAALASHPDIDKIAFTGSSEVGKSIRRSSAGSGKKLALELGGKSAFMVFEDCDMDSAVEGLVDGIWFNQGQVCCAGSRLLVQESIAERFLLKVQTRMEKLRLGNPLDKNTDIGPLISQIQLDRVRGLLAEGENQGAVCWRPSIECPATGYYHLPVLATHVAPANVLAQVEVFGPVLASMRFRTNEEAIALANNSRYGLAASIWSENISLALHVAPQIKAGVIWVNGTNMFDAACGFGGFRESGLGREGGREGMLEYLVRRKPENKIKSRKIPIKSASRISPLIASEVVASGNKDDNFIDRTAKLFIGGKQQRPDGGYAMAVFDAQGRLAGEVGLGNRKDIRNAVAAARSGTGWANLSAHQRAQILYYFAENLAVRADEFVMRLKQLTGTSDKAAREEVEQAIERIFAAAGMADKVEGSVHNPPMRAVTLALKEPVGVLGIVAAESQPLLGLVSMLAPALAMGNRVIAVPSSRWPLVATDLYQVLETSDMPAGSVNIVTGNAAELTDILARHDDVDGLWVVADAETCRQVETLSADNLKRIWTSQGHAVDWTGQEGALDVFLHHASEIKNVWVPYGD